MMVPIIPPELWLRTAQFIPSNVLQNLYSVNPVFLDLALNYKYSDINLVRLWDAETTKLLKHFNHPHIAHRVKRLTLLAGCRPEALMCLNPLDQVADVKMCNALIETIVNFPNVSSLFIICDKEPFQTGPDALLMNTYIACASNLRTLSLFTKSPNFNALFPLTPSVLTSLEEVTLIFTARDHRRADAEAFSTFLQAIASTLTTLTISFSCTEDVPQRLLHSFLRHGGQAAFPKLTSFSLLHLEHPASPDANLLQFLNQHADTLKHVSLQHTKPPPFLSQSLGDLDRLPVPVLPHLETLDLINGSSSQTARSQELASTEGVDAAWTYVQHCRSTLRSLCLTNCSLTLHGLGMLLERLGHQSSESTEGGGLKRLILNVEVLSPQMLDILAEKLPQLERLKVNFICLKSNDDTNSAIWADQGREADYLADEDIEQFVLEMKTRSYARWRLRSFGIDQALLLPEIAVAILTPLPVCIPHLELDLDAPFAEMRRSWEAVTRDLLAMSN